MCKVKSDRKINLKFKIQSDNLNATLKKAAGIPRRRTKGSERVDPTEPLEM